MPSVLFIHITAMLYQCPSALHTKFSMFTKHWDYVSDIAKEELEAWRIWSHEVYSLMSDRALTNSKCGAQRWEAAWWWGIIRVLPLASLTSSVALGKFFFIFLGLRVLVCNMVKVSHRGWNMILYVKVLECVKQNVMFDLIIARDWALVCFISRGLQIIAKGLYIAF